MTTYRNFSTRKTPQSEPIPGSGQIANNAGGFGWAIDDWGRLDRFLILGTEGGTYYVKEQELTQKNAEAVMRCIATNGPSVVARIAEISDSGRAARNDPALFALALCISFGDVATKRAAAEALPKVARIGTHLFHFAQYVQNMRGWGRGLKTAVANWYDERERGSLAYQLVKYQQRDGWSHADLIKLSHPKVHADLYNWVLGERPDTEGRKHEPVIKPGAEPDIAPIRGFMHLQQDPKGLTAKEVAATIQEYRLPREAVPTQFLNDKEVWEALLETDMPMEAMIRNLGNMGKVGLLVAMSDASRKVVERLGDAEALRRSRVHPIKVLVGLRTYAGGKGIRGSNEWPVVPQVVDALDAAFYSTFKNVEPTGKRQMLALDISSSMTAPMMNMPFLSSREAEAALALVTANVEPNHVFVAFSDKLTELSISPRQRLDDVIKYLNHQRFGGTDCSLPMLAAIEKSIQLDAFVVYTDNETWAGRMHPSQALRQYREKFNPQAKSAVVAMTATEVSIADPKDPGMMDFVGFDTETPAAISNFIRG